MLWLWLWLWLRLPFGFGFGCCSCSPSREARQADRVNPKGGAHGCAPFPETQDVSSGNSRPACGPGGFIAGRAVRVCFFGYFLCTSKESDSRVSAKRFCCEATAKIKSTPPQSSPALRAREEVKAAANAEARSRSRWIPAFAGMTSWCFAGLRRSPWTHTIVGFPVSRSG
jgi:hypothetical protein